MNQGSDLLGAAVVGVVVSGAQRIGAQDDASLYLITKAVLAGCRHDVLHRGASLRRYAQPKADRIKLCEVARSLRGQNQVVRGHRILAVRSINLDNLGAIATHQLHRLVETLRDARLNALAHELFDDTHPEPREIL